ncbi:MAG: NAD-dependent epimerase/dehydratase family protein [Nitrospiraceae bacterium]|nr:NAD-dependent epimerase/dehydratase family protein [Nitrospiraceae bacterium]
MKNLPTEKISFEPPGDRTKKLWLVTGGCGFIGKNLAARLLEGGEIKVRVLDNLSAGSEKDLFSARPRGDDLELFRGDIRDFMDCYESSSGAGTVIHLAATAGVSQSVQSLFDDMQTNIAGTLNMLEAARVAEVKKFVFASAGALSGGARPPVYEGPAPEPVSPYGASKLAGEGYCRAYARTFGLSAVALRFGNVYGPGCAHKHSVVAGFFRNALNGAPLVISGDGNQTRDFIYMDDIIRAILLAAKTPFAAGVFQVATRRETSINELALAVGRLVEKRTGIKTTLRFGKPQPGDIRRNHSNISMARTMPGFEPLVSLDEGLDKTLEYFLREYGLFRGRKWVV